MDRIFSVKSRRNSLDGRPNYKAPIEGCMQLLIKMEVKVQLG